MFDDDFNPTERRNAQSSAAWIAIALVLVLVAAACVAGIAVAWWGQR